MSQASGDRDRDKARWFLVLAGLSGLVGPVLLVASFRMNPAPPPGLTTAALAAWAAPREGIILLSAWMQGMGSLLIVVFSFALVEIRTGVSPLAERLTRLAGTVILMVSLTEIAFYIAGAKAAATADVTLGLIATKLIEGVQHVFLIAPAVLLPLGIVLYRSRVLPRIFAYTGLILGATLQTLGLAELFAPLQPVVDVVLIAQSAWFVLAGLVLIVRTPPGLALAA